MSDTPQTPTHGDLQVTNNGAFGQIIIQENSSGSPIFTNTLGLFLLGILAILLTVQLVRLQRENSKLIAQTRSERVFRLYRKA